MKGSRQRYGMLLLALTATFFFEGVAEPGDLQRAVGTVLVGATLMLALYAAAIPKRRLRAAAAIVITIVVGVVIASVAAKGTTVAGIAAVANGLLVALAPPAVVIGLLRDLRATRTVTITVVAGVLCLYLLVGLFFAFAYGAVQNLGGAPFFANGDAATQDPLRRTRSLRLLQRSRGLNSPVTRRVSRTERDACPASTEPGIELPGHPS